MDVLLAWWNDLDPVTAGLVTALALLMLLREYITPDMDNYG